MPLELLLVSEFFLLRARRLFVQLSLARALKRIRRPEVVANQGEIKPRRIAKRARLGSLNHMIRPFKLIEYRLFARNTIEKFSGAGFEDAAVHERAEKRFAGFASLPCF